MVAMIVLFILLSVDIIRVQSESNVCGQICQNNNECLKKCEEYEKNPNRHPISSPFCGLSVLEEGSNMSYPWLASLQYPKSKDEKAVHRPHFCTGVIISDQFILTSAHCIPREPGNYDIMIGSESISFDDPNAMIFNIETFSIPGLIHKQWVKRHESYVKLPRADQANKRNNDLALIKTSIKMYPRIDGNRFVVNSICLPENNYKPIGLAQTMGWGGIGPHKTPSVPSVMMAQNQILTNDQANTVIQQTRIYFDDEGDGKYFIYNITFKDNDLVSMASRAPGLGKQDPTTYQGDSGAPLIQIINGRAFVFGINHVINRGDIPLNIWARIQYYNSWIDQTSKKSLWDLDMSKQSG